MDAATQSIIEYHPGIITARIEGELMFVYRSPILHDEDDMYHKVREILNSTPHRVITSKVIPDEDMFFGEGLYTIYRLGVE